MEVIRRPHGRGHSGGEVSNKLAVLTAQLMSLEVTGRTKLNVAHSTLEHLGSMVQLVLKEVALHIESLSTLSTTIFALISMTLEVQSQMCSPGTRLTTYRANMMALILVDYFDVNSQ